MNTALTLYDLESELTALLDTEPMVEDKEARLEILDDIAKAGEAAVAKRDNVIRFLRFLDLQQGNIDTEIARLKALKDSYAKGQKRVEAYVVSVIEQFVAEPKRGGKKLEGSIGVLSLRKNPDSVEIPEPAAVPEEFKDAVLRMPGTAYQEFIDHLEGQGRGDLVKLLASNREHRPRKDQVKQALKTGRDIAGCDLIYGQNRLVIR